MTTPTKAYRTWRQRLAAPTIGHGSVIQLCRNIYPGSIGCRRLGKNSALTEAECEELISAFRARVKLRARFEMSKTAATMDQLVVDE